MTIYYLYFVMYLQAAGRHETLVGLNLEQKAKWREELEKEKASKAQ